MKNLIKTSVWLVASLCALSATAQMNIPVKKKPGSARYTNYSDIRNGQGKQVEHIQTKWDNKECKIDLVDGKIIGLNVDGKTIPAADWDKYSGLVAGIREQIRKNKIQEKKNEEQARLNQQQQKKNQEQVGRNQEQVRLNEIQAKKNQEQDVKNEAQAKLNQLQEKKNEEQAARNQEQAKRNQAQAMRNQNQAHLNELQAKKNQEQATENERVMKLLIGDLVADKIIPDENGLHSLTFNGYEMTVNGVKQPADVFKKYIEKYNRFSKGEFSYSNDGAISGK